MNEPVAKIRCKARMLRPASPVRASWTFLVIPASASVERPTRGMASVDGRIEGHAFQATLESDGRGSHWLKVTRALREAAGVNVGDTVALEFAPATREPEPRVPRDLRKALAAASHAQALWSGLTTAARRDWIFWITSAKKAETRVRRIADTCDMLASGKRRACCFDRAGIYRNGFGAPEPADRRS